MLDFKLIEQPQLLFLFLIQFWSRSWPNYLYSEYFDDLHRMKLAVDMELLLDLKRVGVDRRCRTYLNLLGLLLS